MTNGTLQSAGPKSVGMGQIEIVRRPKPVSSVLGSCIGLSIFHERSGWAAFAHIVLPSAEGRTGPPGKFADTAVAHMVNELSKRSAGPTGLAAKMAGGASMFANNGPIQIGESNHDAVVSHLESFGIPVAGRNVGGTSGRRVTFDTSTGGFVVEIVGQPAIVL